MAKSEKVAIPRSLKMAVIRIQSEQDLDWDEACEHLAELSDLNEKKFKKAVSREANRRYKSRHMTETNKLKKTFIDIGRDAGFDDGFTKGRNAGYNIAIMEHRISYPCSRCGEPIFLKPGSESTKAAAKFLTSEGWHHSSCKKK